MPAIIVGLIISNFITFVFHAVTADEKNNYQKQVVQLQKENKKLRSLLLVSSNDQKVTMQQLLSLMENQ